jgi:hypothetical protein
MVSYEISVMKKYETQKQLADLEEKRRILMLRINQWREVQLAYIPATGPLVMNITSELLSSIQSGKGNSLAAEDIPLFLPSSLLPDLQNTPGFAKSLSREVQLRIAQADDALADIRHHLRIISGLWQFKKVNISGTGNRPNTRMRTLFNRFNHRMKQSVLRYRAAHMALLAADPGGEWQDRLKDLKNSDVRGPGKDDFYIQEPGKASLGASKGRFEISWIWLVPQPRSEVEADSSEQVFDEGMRIEWSKSQARKKRWEEEVEMIQEEMRRTIVYYEWKELWWIRWIDQQTTHEHSIQHGIAAYAQKQAYYCKCLAESFATAWLPFLQSQGITPDWKHRYNWLIADKKPGCTVASSKDSLDEQSHTDGTEENDEGIDGEDNEEEEYGENKIHDAFELDD